ncbi:MAG: hypothetical protein WBY44_37365 [Bryobacteraceae bacterium]
MDTGAPEAGKAIALWKRIAIRAAAGGAAFGVVVVTGTAVAVYVANRPKEWNDRALKVVHSEGRPLTKLNRDFKRREFRYRLRRRPSEHHGETGGQRMLMLIIFLGAIWILAGRKTSAVIAVLAAVLYALVHL